MNIRVQVIFLLAVSLLTATFSQAAQERAARDSATVILIKPTSTQDPNFSGDRQFDIVKGTPNRPLRVRVMRGDQPVPGWPVYFEVLKVPKKSKGCSIAKERVYSDENGYAETSVTLGSSPGTHLFTATIENGPPGQDFLVYEVTARASTWVFFLIVGLLGGLGMFLFGMEMMSEGMKKSAGDRMRSILAKLTNNRVIAVFVGAFVTMVIQSSSATTVMLVSFVQAQLMTFGQSLGIIIGADIGTTVTAQLIAFKLTDYALLMVAIGIGLMLISNKQKIKNAGETVLGFGLLFFGMHVMSEAMYPLRTYEPFIELLLTLENPILGLLVGTAFTALIQSSSAFTGILIVLATQGLLTIEAGIPLLFGANLGTCVTAGLASIGATREAKRVAIAHTGFKVVGVLMFIAWIPYFADLVRWISPQGGQGLEGIALAAEIVPRQIANAHTIFNVALVVLLPFTTLFATLITKILPDRVDVKVERFKTRYIDESQLSTPTLALSLAKQELIRMGELTRDMVERIIKPFLERDGSVLDEITEDEEEVDFLMEKLDDYLAKISRESVNQERIQEVFQMMYSVTEFEQIADIVAKALTPRAKRWLEGSQQFSEEGRKEIAEYHLKSVKQIERALDIFRNPDLEKATRMKKKFKKYRAMEMDLMRSHYERLRKGNPDTKATSKVHEDLMEQFNRINSHTTNIARVLLEWVAEHKEKTEPAS